MYPYRLLLVVAILLTLARPSVAQQRPLVTEDPEVIGAGRLLVEAGVDMVHDQEYPASGLSGNLLRLPALGFSFGISSIAELQIDGGYNRLSIGSQVAAPLSALLTTTGSTTRDVEDMVVATKIRLKPESVGFPSLAIRFATKLPNAQNETGLGLDTTDFAMTLLGAKTVQSVRVVGNLGFAILGDPTDGQRQNDVLTYGFSVARATTDHAELVGEVNGRVSTRSGQAFPGTESTGRLVAGGRYTRGSYRLDAGFFWGLTPVGPTIGVTTGLTLVFNAFEVP